MGRDDPELQKQIGNLEIPELHGMWQCDQVPQVAGNHSWHGEWCAKDATESCRGLSSIGVLQSWGPCMSQKIFEFERSSTERKSNKQDLQA